MSPSFDNLPVELYSAILLHIPPDNLQQTVLSLSRALPFSPIPLYHLFRSIRILHPRQAIDLDLRLRADTSNQTEHGPGHIESPSSWVSELSLETWQVDAEVFLNLIRRLPNVKTLSLWIGPNFAPEHLEEMFLKYLLTVQCLSLRFRPYVQKATYYQFLKGAYFDSTLLALSTRPSSPNGLHTLSIVQDVPPQTTQHFAQPIVFFRFDTYLSALIHSPSSFTSLKSLRVRIPSRTIVQSLTAIYPHPNPGRDMSPNIPPPIDILDVSTCNVFESDIETLLVRFKDLKHLILDGCTNLLRGGPGQGMGQELDWWSTLGRKCALVGVRKARDREKEVKAWFETQVRNNIIAENQSTNIPNRVEARRPRRGRKGLATATISLRTAPLSPTPSQPSTSRSNEAGIWNGLNAPPKIQIVPPLPILASISLHPTKMIDAATREIINPIVNEFEKGWKEGIRVLWERRSRMGTSFMRSTTGELNVRFLKFKGYQAEHKGLEGLDGLEDVKGDEAGMFFEPTPMDTPVLCVAGPNRDAEHTDRCGHSVAWNIWVD